MEVRKAITCAWAAAVGRQQKIQGDWISISYRVGGKLPQSLLGAQVQELGSLDALLRCMEDERGGAPPSTDGPMIFADNYQKTLSELWIGLAYELLRLVQERKLATGPTDQLDETSRWLRLLRIPLEKHEIADHNPLNGPLMMKRVPPREDDVLYSYSKSDIKRSHIMPSGISKVGSCRWQAIDVRAKREFWIERRSLSDQVMRALAVAFPAVKG